MSEVLKVHRTDMGNARLSIFLASLFFAMSLAPLVSANQPDREVEVNILLGPNGYSEDFTVEVPIGDIITDFEIELKENPWPINQVVTLDDKADWANGFVMDGIDYNSSGLRILPMSHEWDFEGSSQGWSLDSSGGWAHGYDSVLGPTNGVNSGSSAIYTYNGNYPNNMGGPYWATSPSIDCSSCSGTWDLKFWKRLAVESSSYDRAYVSVKTANGGWTNVYSNPYGTTSDGSYTQASYDISNYINGNSAFQVRFGLGTTDSSITYTGWNIDDVLIEPRGNTGTGSGNWTSQPFGLNSGPSMTMNHGMMSIDATVPTSSILRWSLVNPADGVAIPGFYDRDDFQADLSIIDTTSYPQVQLKIHMETTSETPIVHSVKLGGGIIESFELSPAITGWSGYSSHTTGKVAGSTILESPEWRMVNPFSALELDWVGSGNGVFKACFVSLETCTSTDWNTIPDVGIYRLTSPSTTLNLQYTDSTSYSIEHISIDLHKQSSPEDARIDVGFDGVYEWSFSSNEIGPWGLANRFESGLESETLTIPFSGTNRISLCYPYSTSLDRFETTASMIFTLTALGLPVDGVSVEFEVSGKTLFSKSVGFISDFERISLTNSETQLIEQELAIRTADYTVVSNLECHLVNLVISSSSGGDVIVSGLSIPYDYSPQIMGVESQAVIASINAELPTTAEINGKKTVPIPIIMNNPGSVSVLDYGIQTLGSPQPVQMTLANHTETLVAGNDWYEFTSSFDLSSIGVSDAQSHFTSEEWSSSFMLRGSNWARSLSCSLQTVTCTGDQGLSIDSFSFNFNNEHVDFFHRIQLSAIWPDEDAIIASSSIDMNGPLSEPAQLRFGEGLTMGVERDIEVTDWYLAFGDNARSSWDASFYDPANPGIVEVALNFEGLEVSPRSYSSIVDLYLDGQKVDTTQVVENGVATLNFSPGQLASEIELEVDVRPLYGQGVSWKVPTKNTFLIDEVSPILTSSNVGKFDHRPNNIPLELSFEIADRPVLPMHAILHIENTWKGEESIELDLPTNPNGFQGIYTTIIDVSQSIEGDTLSGWLEVYDPAGHMLEDSGTEENPLFIIKFGPDGSPTVLGENLGWIESNPWLHPSVNYSLLVPIEDINGYGDIESVVVDLSSELNEDYTIQWSSDSGCLSSSVTIIVEECLIIGDSTYFDPLFTLRVSFSLTWDFNPDTSIQRKVTISALDDSGQYNSKELENHWRFSSEMEIDTSSIQYARNNAYTAPGNVSELSGDVIWSKDGKLVDYPVQILAMLNETEHYGLSEFGKVSVSITAPNNTGIHPITLDIVNLPIGAIDRTDIDEIAAWMVVDGNAPQVVEMVSPNRLEIVQERDWENLNFEILVNESEGLDIETMRMNWLIVPNGMAIPELALLGGNVSMELIAGTGAGKSIPLMATLNVEEIIPEVSRKNSWDLWVWVEGQDYAGQEIISTFNSRISPLAVIQLANREADIVFTSEDIVIKNEYPGVQDTIWVNITLHNNGQVEGTTSIRVEVIENGDDRRLIDIVNIEVPANSSISFETKWIPEKSGTAWIEITTPNGMNDRTAPVQVEKGESTFVIESLDGASNTMLTGFGIIMFLMIGLLGYLVISGKRDSEYDYDEEVHD